MKFGFYPIAGELPNRAVNGLPVTLVVGAAVERSSIFQHGLRGAAGGKSLSEENAGGADHVGGDEGYDSEMSRGGAGLQTERKGSHGSEGGSVTRIDREPMYPADRAGEQVARGVDAGAARTAGKQERPDGETTLWFGGEA